MILNDSALNIQSGEALARFDLGTVKRDTREWAILTGFEIYEDVCWWCGESTASPGKRKAHYCRGRSHHDVLSCFRQYWDHFNWGYAVYGAKERARYCCENCGQAEGNQPTIRYRRTNLEVHHIVPLQGAPRFFSAFNLPWNLIVLCHDCHQEVHAAMRPPIEAGKLDPWLAAPSRGQGIMALPLL